MSAVRVTDSKEKRMLNVNSLPVAQTVEHGASNAEVVGLRLWLFLPKECIN